MSANETNVAAAPVNNLSINTTNGTSNITPVSVHDANDTVSVFLVPASIILLLIGTAIIIFVLVRRRSRRQQDRLHFTPVYYSVGHEDNDWESHLMDDELGKHVNIVKPIRSNQTSLKF